MLNSSRYEPVSHFGRDLWRRQNVRSLWRNLCLYPPCHRSGGALWYQLATPRSNELEQPKTRGSYISSLSFDLNADLPLPCHKIRTNQFLLWLASRPFDIANICTASLSDTVICPENTSIFQFYLALQSLTIMVSHRISSRHWWFLEGWALTLRNSPNLWMFPASTASPAWLASSWPASSFLRWHEIAAGSWSIVWAIRATRRVVPIVNQLSRSPHSTRLSSPFSKQTLQAEASVPAASGCNSSHLYSRRSLSQHHGACPSSSSREAWWNSASLVR